MTDWSPFRLSIDSALIANLPTPGLLLIEKANSPRQWDERNGYGWSGSFPVFIGQRLSAFDLTFKMYNDDDWTKYQALRPILVRPPFGKRPTSLDIVHPILMDLEIRSVVITDVLQLTPIDNGGWAKTIECLSFRRPKVALAKPEASKQKQSDDPYDKMIERLTKQFDELANQ